MWRASAGGGNHRGSSFWRERSFVVLASNFSCSWFTQHNPHVPFIAQASRRILFSNNVHRRARRPSQNRIFSFAVILAMRTIASVLAFAASALAYSVVAPTNATGFVNDGQNTVSWTKVSTDAANFTIVLVNQVRRAGPAVVATNQLTSPAASTRSRRTSRFSLRSSQAPLTPSRSTPRRLAGPRTATATRSTWSQTPSTSAPSSPSRSSSPSTTPCKAPAPSLPQRPRRR